MSGTDFELSTYSPPESQYTLPLEVGQTLAGTKILFVFHSMEIGGAETQALYLAGFLKHELRADVEIWAFSPGGPAVERCARLGLSNRSLPYPLDGNPLRQAAGLWRFVRELRRARPTVLLPYTMAQNIICALTWRLGGAKLCIWNQRDEGRARSRRMIEALAAWNTPLFISNSTHGAGFLVKAVHAPRDRVHVVANGVPPTTAPVNRRTWRFQRQIPEACFVANMVANLHRYKDHATLLRAWRLVLDALAGQTPPPRLLLAGRLEDTARALQQLAADLALGDTVQFLGPVNDVPSLLNACDLCVFSSRFEGCPNGILESMAAGLPVVASDIPGIREALGPHCDEVLAPVNDPRALASRIIQMALDPERRRRHASANHARAAQVFSVQRMCHQTATLIAAALRAK